MHIKTTNLYLKKNKLSLNCMTNSSANIHYVLMFYKTAYKFKIFIPRSPKKGGVEKKAFYVEWK